MVILISHEEFLPCSLWFLKMTNAEPYSGFLRKVSGAVRSLYPNGVKFLILHIHF